MRCSICNANNSPDAGYCSNCGRSLTCPKGEREWAKAAIIGGTLAAIPGMISLIVIADFFISADYLSGLPWQFYVFGISNLLIFAPLAAYVGVLATAKLPKFIKHPVLAQVLGGLMGGVWGLIIFYAILSFLDTFLGAYFPY